MAGVRHIVVFALVQAQRWEYKQVMSAAASVVPRRVLVVDDHDDCRDLLASLVADSGCDVRVASTGAEAIVLTGQFLPDVVLLDIGLPDMSGYQVAATIRANPVTTDAFIAAVTGYGMGSDRKQAACAGIDVLLSKPVSWSELRLALSGVRGPASAGTATLSS
jgi:two-component system, sensor histidine kinase